MAERHHEEREVAQARERLTRITEELSRRATPDYVKGKARERADEMSGRAKAMARERTTEMKERLLDSPWALGLIGGAVGAIAGKMIGDRTRDRHGRGGYEFYEGFEAPYDEYTATHRYPRTGYEEGYGAYGSTGGYDTSGAYGYGAEGVQSDTIITEDPMYGLDVGERGDRLEGIRETGQEGEGGGMKEKARDLKHKASERMSGMGERARDLGHKASERMGEMGGRTRESGHDLRSRAGHMAHGIRERIPSGHQMRGGMRRVSETTSERPELWGIAALAVGALFGAMMPITNKERRFLGPMKSDAQGRIASAKDEVVDRAKGFKHGVEEGLGLSGGEQEDARGMGNGRYNEGADISGRSDIREREPRSPSAEQTSLASQDTGAVGGYGSDTGYAGTSPTYTAGGKSEEEKKEQGFQPVSEPDVTRH